MGFDRMRVRNFRALADVDLELRPVNVIFGPNGAGKSSLLDAIHFFHDEIVDEATSTHLREPGNTSLGLFLGSSDKEPEADSTACRTPVRHYYSRSFDLDTLKRRGSESSHQIQLCHLGSNAWSVFRNIHDKRDVDARYNTIVGYMAEAFPTLRGIVPDQTSPGSVSANFREHGRSEPVLVSGASDGWLQLLLLLMALFAEGNQDAVLLFDEPETSLHPWAIAVLARAMARAATQWGKQVFAATHSPVLISQFSAEDVLIAEAKGGYVRFKRLSEASEVHDLLDEYAAGALYMSEAIARQSPDQIDAA